MRQHILIWLAANVPESRVNHVLRVEQTAISLAQMHGLNSDRAAQAALMHDLAKYFEPQQLLEIARREGIALDPVNELNPHLPHADVGAIVARDEFAKDEFDIQEPEVLAAIADHTLGRPGMSALSCVVFLADSLEPGRGDTPELHLLRQISQQDLHQAVQMACDYTLKHLIEIQRLMHPCALLTRNWFLHHCTHLLEKKRTDMTSSTPFKLHEYAFLKGFNWISSSDIGAIDISCVQPDAKLFGFWLDTSFCC